MAGKLEPNPAKKGGDFRTYTIYNKLTRVGYVLSDVSISNRESGAPPACWCKVINASEVVVFLFSIFPTREGKIISQVRSIRGKLTNA